MGEREQEGGRETIMSREGELKIIHNITLLLEIFLRVLGWSSDRPPSGLVVACAA